MNIDKIYFEGFIEFLVFLLFLLSFLNTFTLLFSVILITTILVLLQKQIGAVKTLMLISLRTIINPGLAIPTNNIQFEKWLIILTLNIFLIFTYPKLDFTKKNKLKKIFLFIIIFGIYNFFSSIIFSSLPLIAVSKLFVFVLAFLGILCGVAYTFDSFDWFTWLLKIFISVEVFSFFTLKLPIGYFRNGRDFQGILNQPNMFGIFSVLTIAMLLTYMKMQKRSFFEKIIIVFIIVLSFYLIIPSSSRTSFLSAITLFLFNVVNIKKTLLKIILILILIIFIFIFFLINNSLYNFLVNYLTDNNPHEPLKTREKQIANLTNDFKYNPFFGIGFLTPRLPYKSFKIVLSYPVEPGNLFLAVLAYSGIFGFFIFLSFWLNIFLSNKKYFKTFFSLPLSILLINLGETTFFSPNDISMILYSILSFYILYNNFIEKS